MKNIYRLVWAFIVFLAAAASARADSFGLASGGSGFDYDLTAFIVNASTSPITVNQIYGWETESCHSHYIIPGGPYTAWRATAAAFGYDSSLFPPSTPFTIAPGEARAFHGLIHQFHRAGHLHTEIDYAGSGDPHDRDVFHFVAITDTNGDLEQILGPAPHLASMTHGSRTVPNNKYGSGTSVGQQPIALRYSADYVIANGPVAKAFDVRTTSSELPSDPLPTDKFEIGYKDVGVVPTNGAAVAHMPNDWIKWSHHYILSATASQSELQAPSTYYALYRNDAGETYSFQKMVTGIESGDVCLQDAALVAPASSSTVATSTPTLSWTTLPLPPLSSLINYIVDIASTPIQDGTNLILSSSTPISCTYDAGGNGACSFAVPAGVLASAQSYYWRVNIQSTLPGIPGSPPDFWTNDNPPVFEFNTP